MKVHNLLVTGSLQSGGENITSISSSVVSTVTNVSSSVSASISLLSSSMMTSMNNLSSSMVSVMATTGSNIFVGNQTISGSIVPAVNGIYDLGSSTHEFRHLYLSSASLYIDGTKVLGSTTQELQITTDSGQSFKILEAGSDTITLQSADGNITLATSGGGDVILDPTSGIIALKGTTTLYAGNRLLSSDGNAIQIGNSVTMTGSLIVTGFIETQELKTTYISSSILYRSGSTKFGDELTDTHAFTGSLLVSGSISVPGSGLISGSSQILNGSGVWSGSAQLPSGVVSGSAQLPSGTVSGSAQVDVMSTTNIARLATTGSNTFNGTTTLSGSLVTTSTGVFAGRVTAGGSMLLGEIQSSYSLLETTSGNGIWLRPAGNSSPTGLFVSTSGNLGINNNNPGSRLSVSGTNSGSTPLVDLVASGTGTFQRGVRLLNSGMNAGDHIMMAVGQADGARNMGQFYFQYNGAGSTSNRISMGLHSVDDVFNIWGNGNVEIGSTFNSGYKFDVAGQLRAYAGTPLIVSMSTIASNDAVVAARWTSGVGLEMRYNPNSALCYIDSTYPISSGQVYGDIHFRQNVGSTMTTRMLMKAETGFIGINTTSPTQRLHVNGYIRTNGISVFKTGGSVAGFIGHEQDWLGTGSSNNLICASEGGNDFKVFTNGTTDERIVATSTGYVHLGKGWGATNHRINLEVAQGNNILVVSAYAGASNDSVLIKAASGANPNASGTVMQVTTNSSTGRSISAGGTINASGNDYAEYMLKAVTDNISKGDIVGVNSQGLLTNIFTDAVSFVVKSTDPSYVGGDAWGNVVGKRPERTADQTEEEFTPILAEFEARLEVEREKVDRIAFSGQVPVNVTGATVGDYIIPIETEDGKITGQSITNPTFEQYQISVGKVWKIMEDGRAFIAVKIG